METYLPLGVLVFAFGLLYLALRAHQIRVQHREYMAALEKGVDIKPITVDATPAFGHRVYLLRGLLWIFAGAALAGILAVAAPLFEPPSDAGPRAKLELKLLRAKSLREIGASPEQIEAMEKEIERAGRLPEPPPNLVIVATLPMAVGVAYLIFFALEERRVRGLPPA